MAILRKLQVQFDQKLETIKKEKLAEIDNNLRKMNLSLVPSLSIQNWKKLVTPHRGKIGIFRKNKFIKIYHLPTDVYSSRFWLQGGGGESGTFVEEIVGKQLNPPNFDTFKLKQRVNLS